MLSKFTQISLVKYNVKYFNACDDGLVHVLVHAFLGYIKFT
jgi:hypothetical protein